MNRLEYIIILILILTSLNKVGTDFLFREGIILDTKNNFKAVGKYEDCLKANPNYTKAMFNLAYLYIRKEGRAGIQKAKELLIQIRDLDPFYERIHYRLAGIYCELGEWEKAIKEFNIAIGQRKKDYEAYYDLGRVYYHIKKDFKSALYLFRQAKKYGAPHKDIDRYIKSCKILQNRQKT